MTRETKIDTAYALADLIDIMDPSRCLESPFCLFGGNCPTCEIHLTIEKFLDFMYSEFPNASDNDFVTGLVYHTLGRVHSSEIVDEGNPYDYM